MIRCAAPRCSDCAQPLGIVEPFAGGVGQQCRCPCCGVQLRVYNDGVDGWTVGTVAEHAGVRSWPLPAIASPALHRRFLTACRSVVGRLVLPGDGVEPGMAGIEEVRRGL